ncbi:MAG: hypothetical protein IJW82_02160 [Clostridia bacterium]|nr:hypothetical protein [Clostridia bacterium]
MIKYKKQYLFSITFLENNNLNGYTCKLIVTADNSYDFKTSMKSTTDDLDDFVKETLVLIDKSFIFNKNTNNSFENNLIDVLKNNKQKMYAIDFDFSVQKFAEHLFKKLNFNCVMENKDYRIESIELSFKENESVIIKEN